MDIFTSNHFLNKNKKPKQETKKKQRVITVSKLCEFCHLFLPPCQPVIIIVDGKFLKFPVKKKQLNKMRTVFRFFGQPFRQKLANSWHSKLVKSWFRIKHGLIDFVFFFHFLVRYQQPTIDSPGRNQTSPPQSQESSLLIVEVVGFWKTPPPPCSILDGGQRPLRRFASNSFWRSTCQIWQPLALVLGRMFRLTTAVSTINNQFPTRMFPKSLFCA